MLKQPKPQDAVPPPGDIQPAGRAALLQKYPWITFLLPFMVFMLAGSLEPTSAEEPGGATIGLVIPYTLYPWVYTAKIVLTVAAVIFVLPGYRAFPFRVSPAAVAVGVVGVVAWIGLCSLDVEQRFLAPLLKPIGMDWIIGSGDRSGFNPLEQLSGNPAGAWAFLAVRFLGLAIVVAVIEEFFLRGWLMRFVVDADWPSVPFGKVNATAVAAGTLMPMLMHPAELLAAAVWFSMVTWLMVRTRNIWDCVVAHAITNLLLGVYVVAFDQWQLM